MEPKALTGFESHARRLRYQALGAACHQHDIKSLLFAHHEDDVAETILLRLAAGHGGLGLRGMSPQANIPECDGLYGSQPKGPALNYGSLKLRGLNMNQKPLQQEGVVVLRPLLDFSKARLRATCEEGAIEWVEDQTNQDVTLTPRNTARFLLESGKLPDALKKPSLLRLSRSFQTKQLDTDALVETFYRKCDVQNLDLCSGTLRVKIPDPEKCFNLFDEWARKTKSLVLSQCIRKLYLLIGPDENIPLSKLESAVGRIFSSSFDKTTEKKDIDSFTVGSIQFNCQNLSVPRKKEWLLHRQPPIQSKLPTTIFPPSTTDYDRHNPQRHQYHLWDGRYWIHIENHTEKTIAVTSLTAEQLGAFRKVLSFQDNKLLDLRLKHHAEGKIRWTLPVIVSIEETGNFTKDSEVIALPTFDIGRKEWNGRKDWRQQLRWKVGFKYVDLENCASRDVITVAWNYGLDTNNSGKEDRTIVPRDDSGRENRSTAARDYGRQYPKDSGKENRHRQRRSSEA